MQNEYRCTRPDFYHPGCLGHRDLTARQGHYIIASSVEEAEDIMSKKFPKDSKFDITVHKTDVGPKADRIAIADIEPKNAGNYRSPSGELVFCFGVYDEKSKSYGFIVDSQEDGRRFTHVYNPDFLLIDLLIAASSYHPNTYKP